MWKSFENIGLQTSEKVSWEKKEKKHAQNIRSTVHRTGDLIIFVYLIDDKLYNQHQHPPCTQGGTQQKLYTEGLSTAKLLPQTAHSN